MAGRKGSGRGEDKASPRLIKAREKSKRALEMRKAGAHYDVIAERLGYADPSGAQRAVMAGLRELTREDAEDVRMLELARLDALWMSAYQKAVTGSVAHVGVLLKIMERRAKLMGLDAPQVIEWRDELKRAGVEASEIFERMVAQFMAEQTAGDG